jgi:hypothetical protein
MVAVVEIRRFAAILCVGMILALAWNPASFDLLGAILVPVVFCFRFVSLRPDQRRSSNQRPQTLPFFSLIPARAPPVS